MLSDHRPQVGINYPVEQAPEGIVLPLGDLSNVNWYVTQRYVSKQYITQSAHYKMVC
jgi:hypothetical protein